MVLQSMIPSSISLIFLKSTQFAPSQLFLLNILFDFTLWSIFLNLSDVFFADKFSTFSPISLILATSSGLGSIVARRGRLMSCRAREMQMLAELSRASKNFSFLSAAGFLVFFGKIITGSGLIDLVQYILPRLTTIPNPSVRNR